NLRLQNPLTAPSGFAGSCCRCTATRSLGPARGDQWRVLRGAARRPVPACVLCSGPGSLRPECLLPEGQPPPASLPGWLQCVARCRLSHASPFLSHHVLSMTLRLHCHVPPLFRAANINI